MHGTVYEKVLCVFLKLQLWCREASLLSSLTSLQVQLAVFAKVLKLEKAAISKALFISICQENSDDFQFFPVF